MNLVNSFDARGLGNPHFKFLWNLNMMARRTSKVKQGLNWGCDSSPPLNKNLVPRFKSWGKKIKGSQANTIFMIRFALLEDVDSFLQLILTSLLWNLLATMMMEERKLDRIRSSQRSSDTRSTHGMRRKNVSWAETQVTHQEGYGEADDEGSIW